jgi:hypothetical protein
MTQKKLRSIRTRRVQRRDRSTAVARTSGAYGGSTDISFILACGASPHLTSSPLSLSLSICQSRKQEFIEALLQFIQESRLSAALFLSGVDMSNRTDAQMTFVIVPFLLIITRVSPLPPSLSFPNLTKPNITSSTPTYHIRPPNSPLWENSPLSTIPQLPIPVYTSPVAQHPGAPQNEEEGPIPFIPGGGLTRRILSNLPAETAWNVPTGALLQFVLEGDNRSDASLMAAVVAKILSLQVRQWKQPFSWQQGLFGTPHDQTLYG